MYLHRAPGLVAVGLALVAALAVCTAALAAPAALTASEVVLTQADVGPDFVVVSSGETIKDGLSLRTQTLARAGKQSSTIELEGSLVVSSFAFVAANPQQADQIFDQLSNDLVQGTQELPLSTVGDRSRGAILWGRGPFDPAVRILAFKAGPVVGWVQDAGFDAPTTLDDLVPLANIMAERARR